MRSSISFVFISVVTLILSFSVSAQRVQDNYYKKGNFFIYWGWNNCGFTTSDIHFTGTNYDFTLYDVVAKQRQERFKASTYLNPKWMTIPQYNLRIGYFIGDHYQLSFGADHMKYVMVNNQQVTIDGYINNSGTQYDGTYDNQQNFTVATDFLLYEHTDGLNYENLELRRFDVLWGRKYLSLAVNEGMGIGFLLPRTNATLLNNERNDKFHLAGYGFAGVGALTLTIYKYFFIQSELKGGFINMPDVRTTKYKEDKASQHFWFYQYNIVFGVNFRIPGLGSPKKEKA